MKSLTLALVLSLMCSACMKDAIGGLGMGTLDEREAPKTCADNIVLSYQNSKHADTDGTMKHNYEVTFDCQMPDGV